MIRPEELRRPTPAEEAQIGLAEVLIDARLKHDWSPGLTVYVEADPDWTPRVLDALLRLYKLGGWMATLRSGSQREPAYLVFTA